MALPVQTLCDDTEFGLSLKPVPGAQGLDRTITHPRIQKAGLVLAGSVASARSGRAQVLGQTEVEYLATLAPDAQRRAVQGLAGSPAPCVILTGGRQLGPELLDVAAAAGMPVLVTDLGTGDFISRLHDLLDERLSPGVTVHGVLVDVHGVGVLVLGQSGIGKSECALDLVLRGHRLVADDVVVMHRRNQQLIGTGSPLTRHLMEVRGLGIINVRDLFGAAAVRDKKQVELVVEMIEWHRDMAFDRLGLDTAYERILDREVAKVRLPVRPGRNVASIVEVAARHHLLKLQGKNPARELEDRIDRERGAADKQLPPLETD